MKRQEDTIAAPSGAERHPFSMGRRFSLGRNKHHQYVYRRGKSFPGRYMVLVYLKGRDLKVAFSASAKVGNSVVRNRVRRMMREDFRLLRHEVKMGKYIFIARTRAVEAAHPQLTGEMRYLLRKAGLLIDREA